MQRQTPLTYNEELARQVAGLVIAGFEGKKADFRLKKLLEKGLGGVILFKRNLGSPASVRKLTDSLRKAAGDDELLVAIDHEGGRVTKLDAPFTHFPSAATLGKSGDPELAREVGAAMGRELAAVGINLNFAPVLDLATPQTSAVIGDRSFGADPDAVFAVAYAYAQGMQSQGVAACAKHFPGHGSVGGDSHIELPESDYSAEEMQRHIEPFRKMAEGEIAGMMSAHIKVNSIDPYYPATFSSRMLTGMLRDEMGYRGVVFTDDIRMAGATEPAGALEAAYMALKSGADVVLVSENIDFASEVINRLDLCVRHMAIDMNALVESAERMKLLKKRFSLAEGRRPPLDVIGCPEHRELARKVAELE